jgi:SAM-dependent methyltransferase
MGMDLYDERPYTDHAYAETHPGRVAAVARLARWIPPPVATARVLELGCGRGGNLLPMAAGLPRATFVGVDAASSPIAEAQRIAREAGLPNVSFVHSTFDDLALADESFDYVVCHGVASWIPHEARRTLLRRVRAALTPTGVAYVSFNVLPGWYERLPARDWLRFASSTLGEPIEHGPGSLRWLAAHIGPERADVRRQYESVAHRIDEAGAAYAFHEYLSPELHPLLVASFLGEASRAGLSYLEDAIPPTTSLDLLPDEVRARARTLAPADAQQLVDFVRSTAFRRALLVRADTASREATIESAGLDADAMVHLHVASRLHPTEPKAPGAACELFGDGEIVVQVTDPATRATLHELASNAPRPLPFDTIARRCAKAGDSEAACGALARELLDLWMATGALDLYACGMGAPAVAGDRPIACPVARWHAQHGGTITSRLHHEVLVPDSMVRWVLGRLDGTRTRDDLAREARSLAAGTRVTDDELSQVVRAAIERLTACGVIVGG